MQRQRRLSALRTASRRGDGKPESTTEDCPHDHRAYPSPHPPDFRVGDGVSCLNVDERLN